MKGKEPVIVAFLCNWCSYAAADSAGNNRKQYPANVRVIRVMCSGRVEPGFVLKAFREGADGVLICGCHPGDCHYVEGNVRAKNRAVLLSNMLDQFGIERERFRLEWISATEGDKFVQVTTEMVEKIKAMGPLDLKTEAVIECGEGA